METKILNYRIIIERDKQTGTGKIGYTALCPTLGVADDGDSIEEAIENIRQAIQAYVESLIADKLPVPIDQPEKDIVTTTQINVSGKFQYAC
jgi:predicted RNase H-like HicB family nuclease